ncbi:MAG: hypothetical protein M9899_07395 [Bdellovibrionaceae bacterium]|nr:hypothetical protein [Pseudobdellovibrionaceae bacterium]
MNTNPHPPASKYLFLQIWVLTSVLILTACQRPLFPTYNKKICTPPSSPIFEGLTEGQEDYKSYQVGDSWNRKSMEDPGEFPYQVFQLFRTGMGQVGTGFYLGKFADKHIVMTAGHVYDDLNSCHNEVNFLVRYKSLRFYVTCDDWHYKFAENDAMIFSITTENPEHLNLLKPVEFNTEHQTGEALNLISVDNDYDYNFDWKVDDQKDCRLLSTEEKVLEDPDCNVSGALLQSWSLPVGCDGKHGDSGAPVYDKNLRLKGLLWTGKFPKLSQSSNQLLSDLNAQSPTLWKEYNYIVPMSALEKEIDKDLSSKFHLSMDSRNILSALTEKIKADNTKE